MRRITLYVLIILAYLGANQFVYPLPLGIAVFPFRVWLPLAVVVCLLTRQWGQPVRPRLLRRVYVFLALWLVYGAVQMVYVRDPEAGAHYWLFLLTNLVFSYLVSEMIVDMHELSMYMKVATLVLVGLLALATWEYTTGRHLLLSAFNVTTATRGTLERMLYSSREEHRALLYVPTGTFMNPNDFAYALTLLMPMALGWLILTRSVVTKVVLASVSLWSVFIIAVTQSRACLFTLLLVICPVFFFGGVTSPRTRLSIVVVVALLVLVVAVGVAASPQWSEVVRYRLEDALAALDWEYLRENPRWALTVNAAHFMVESYGCGVGTRQSVGLMEAGEGVAATGRLASVHNMWAEILGDYGLVIFVPLVIGYGAMMRFFWHRRRATDDRETAVHILVAVSMMLGMLPAALSPSGGIYLIPTFATLGYVLAAIKSVTRRDEDYLRLTEDQARQA